MLIQIKTVLEGNYYVVFHAACSNLDRTKKGHPADSLLTCFVILLSYKQHVGILWQWPICVIHQLFQLVAAVANAIE